MLTHLPIPRVLWRRNLVMGCEREPFMLLTGVCGIISVTSMSLVAFGICGAIWFAGDIALGWMAKADPQLCEVYMRSLRWRSHYPAYSRPYRRN